MWVWKLVYERLWNRHGSVKLDIVQQWLRLWDMLSDQMRAIEGMLCEREIHHRDGDKPMPTKLVTGLERRRVVQPTKSSLRHGQAGVHEDRLVEGWNSPYRIP